MKKHVFTLGICLALLQVSKPSQAQTMAKAQTASIEIQAVQPQADPTPVNEIKAVASEKSVLTTKDVDDTGYEHGDILINPGISFGVIGYGGYLGSASGFLPLTANLEYSLNNKFAVGPYFGFYSRSYTYANNYRFTALSFGGRFTFHATGLLNDAFDGNMDPKKLDFYASANLGIENQKFTYDGAAYNYGDGTFLRLGVNVGARYMFSPKFGAFLELGRGVFGFSTLGLSFKL